VSKLEVISEADPHVSVLIPTLGRPDFLRDAVRSALLQSVRGLEIIVGDDGDEGETVVATVNDSRVSYVKNPRRLGMAENSTSLLDRARGRFLALLNDDDRFLPGFLPKCLDVFDRMPDLGVVFTNHFIEYRKRTVIRRCALQAGRHDNFSYEFLHHGPVACSAAVFRREAWLEARPLTRETHAGDLILFARIADAGWPFYYLDEPLMIYRAHENSVSGSKGFRHEAVKAWESLRFKDAEAESLRETRLADALVGRASLNVQEGRPETVLPDLERAKVLGPSSRTRLLLVTTLAQHRWAAQYATRLGARVRWRPWS
jgi:glycosyltransferase involved in cell wall biosynthesis